MDLNINITTSDSCKVIILDKTSYLPEALTETVKGKFKYSETVSVDVLQLNKVKETEYREITYTSHNSTVDIQIPVKFDGWFTVNHIVLPSKEWFMYNYYNNYSNIDIYEIVYFTDGLSIYKYIRPSSVTASAKNLNIYPNVELVTIDEVLEINPLNTTISRTLKDYVSICFLRKCYINLCKQIFEDRGFSQCWSKNNIDSDLVYKRDLVWMAINVIKYLTECEQLAEVERIIETLYGCNGLCTSSNITSKTNGCGCSK